MTTSPTQISSGTVAARISAFQRDQKENSVCPNTAKPVPTRIRCSELPSTIESLKRSVSSLASFRDEVRNNPGYRSCAESNPICSTNRMVDADDEEVCSGPPPTPLSNQSNITLGAISPNGSTTRTLEHHRPHTPLLGHSLDGPSELATVRTRLRSIVESGEVTHGIPEQGEGMLGELDSLLQHAIEEHTGSENDDELIPKLSPSSSTMSSETPELSQKPFANPFRSPLRSSTIKSEAGSPQKHSELPLQPQRGPCTEYDKLEPSPSEKRTELVPPRTYADIDTLSPGSSSPQKPTQLPQPPSEAVHLKQQQQLSFPLHSEPGRPLRKPSIFSRYRSNPVKQRAALFETTQQKPNTTDSECKAPHAENVHHKVTWAHQERAIPSRPSRPMRRIVHSQLRSSETDEDSCLIALTLPQLVKRLGERERSSGNDASDETEDYDTAQQSYDSIDLLGTEPSDSVKHDIDYGIELDHGHHDQVPPDLYQRPATEGEYQSTTEPDEHTFIANAHEPDAESKDVSKSRSYHDAGVRARPYATARGGMSESTTSRGPVTSPMTTATVSNDVNEHRKSYSSNNAQNPPSTIRNKIHQLMTAAKRGGSGTLVETSHASRTAVATERVRDDGAVSTQRLTHIRAPTEEQSRAFFNAPTLPSSNSWYEKENGGAAIKRNSILDPTQSSLELENNSPLRGRVQTAQHPLLNRGSPYAIEQRFNLSPTRSQSRDSRGSVRVSIEVRSSPERGGEGYDDHLVIVRATVEPEETAEE